MQYQTCSVFTSRFQQILSILIVYCGIHYRQCLCYMHLVWDSFRNEDESETSQKKFIVDRHSIQTHFRSMSDRNHSSSSQNLDSLFRFVQFQCDFVHGQNNSRYRHWALLRSGVKAPDFALDLLNNVKKKQSINFKLALEVERKQTDYGNWSKHGNQRVWKVMSPDIIT